MTPADPTTGGGAPSPLISVLLVEDDSRIRRALGAALRDESYGVLEASDGLEALATLGRQPVDLVLLDLLLPRLDGIEVCSRIRAQSDLPIIIVSARATTEDVIAGLEAGADDYMTKPIVAAELAARIRSLLRRIGGEFGPPRRLAVGDLAIDPAHGTAMHGSAQLDLTKTEYRLLLELLAADGALVTREDLLSRVWGYGYFGDTRLLDVHIRRLRRKVETDPSAPDHIVAVRGFGYRVVG